MIGGATAVTIRADNNPATPKAETRRIAGWPRGTLPRPVSCQALASAVEACGIAPFSNRSIISSLSVGGPRKSASSQIGFQFHPVTLLLPCNNAERVWFKFFFRRHLQKLAAGTAELICVTQSHSELARQRSRFPDLTRNL